MSHHHADTSWPPIKAWPRTRPDLKASSGSTVGQLTVFTLLVDGGPPRRTHTREDESIYLLGGPGLTPGTRSCQR